MELLPAAKPSDRLWKYAIVGMVLLFSLLIFAIMAMMSLNCSVTFLDRQIIV